MFRIEDDKRRLYGGLYFDGFLQFSTNGEKGRVIMASLAVDKGNAVHQLSVGICIILQDDCKDVVEAVKDTMQQLSCIFDIDIYIEDRQENKNE